ncbi:MAG: right-handed parallel beta-helix repeat-containing protein [Planctomycetota bacterium]
MSNDPTAILPDGREFAFWTPAEPAGQTFVVAREHPGASDENTGTAEAPLKTISRAAELAGPGDCVRIGAGVYRECVRPTRGGDGPEAVITYQAVDGEEVVITGGEIIPGPWQLTDNWMRLAGGEDVAIYQAVLPREWFIGRNPFTMANRAVAGNVGGFNQAQADIFPTLVKRCGLVFQNGRRLQQTDDFEQLAAGGPGRYWPDPSGLMVYVRPFDDADPNQCEWEATARAQCFAPDTPELGYIRLRGLTFRCAGNPFPFIPQEGAVSAVRGHHWVIEDCTVEQVNAVGIDVGKGHPRREFLTTGGGHILRRNVVRECGVCGLAGLHLEHGLIEDNLVEDCCWHDVEPMWESAGIKFHRNEHSLLRRNVVRRIRNGSGMWLDFANHNMRVTGNLIVNVHSLFGGIFAEASHTPSRIDNNIVIGSKTVDDAGGHGVYAHDTDYLTIDHNLFANVEGFGVYLPQGQADRFVYGRGSCSRRHRVERNAFVSCRRFVALVNTDNICDANAYTGGNEDGPFRLFHVDEWLDLDAWGEFHGFEERARWFEAGVNLDDATLVMTLSAGEAPASLPSADDLPGCTWSGKPRRDADTPGPFEAPRWSDTELWLDPRTQ